MHAQHTFAKCPLRCHPSCRIPALHVSPCSSLLAPTCRWLLPDAAQAHDKQTSCDGWADGSWVVIGEQVAHLTLLASRHDAFPVKHCVPMPASKWHGACTEFRRVHSLGWEPDAMSVAAPIANVRRKLSGALPHVKCRSPSELVAPPTLEVNGLVAAPRTSKADVLVALCVLQAFCNAFYSARLGECACAFIVVANPGWGRAEGQAEAEAGRRLQ